MKSFKETARRMVYILLVEIILMGVVTIIVDRFLISFIKEWPLWQILLLLAAALAASAVIYLVYAKLGQLVKKKNLKSTGKKVASLQSEAILEFFSMQTAGVELEEKPLDVATAADMILNKYNSRCKVGSNFNQYVRSIREDYINLTSCDAENANIKVFELAALKDLQGFLTYISVSAWNHPDKLSFTEKYSQQAKALADGIFKDMEEGEKQEIEFKSNRLNYLQRLCDEREGNLGQYVPLSYKSEDDTLKRYSLLDLDELDKNKDGFVLSADAGYGKSWSIIELAGAGAKKAQLDESETPILIKMGQVAENEQPILKTVGEILFPGEGDLEKVRKFLQTQKVTLYIDGMDEACFKNKAAARREMLAFRESCPQLRIIGGTRGADKDKFPKLTAYSIFDLSDEQVREFMTKQITDAALYERAEFDYFKNEQTPFLRELRSPFYLKCYIDFVLEGETAPDSSTDVFRRCTEKMIEREIQIKGFAATKEILVEFLREVANILGDERYMGTLQVVKSIKEEWIYDSEEYAPLIAIKDTLIELGILSEESGYQRGGSVLGFRHEEYKNLYSQLANDTSALDW